ncbi:MAG: alpha/beta fold hydrolase [Bdellovibrionota bacterium]
MIEINLAAKAKKKDPLLSWSGTLVRLSVFLAIIALFAFKPSEASEWREACLDRLERNILEKQKAQDSYYRMIDPTSVGIRPGNESRFLRGRNRQAIILVHGFLASPQEVSQLAAEINRAGWTVYLPLIYGFGGSTPVANAVTVEDWRRSITESVEAVSTCYGHISMAGFSLGGGLITDYVLNNPLVTTAGMIGDTQIDSVILLSPYTKAKSALMKGLLYVMANWLGFNDIDFGLLNTLSFGSKDLSTIKKFPEFHNESMPVRAADRVVEFASQFENIRETLQSEIPIYLAFSEGDGTVDTEWGDQFLKKHFLNVRNKIYLKEEGIPHQIQIKEDFANPNADDLYERAVKFLRGHTHGRDLKQDF